MWQTLRRSAGPGCVSGALAGCRFALIERRGSLRKQAHFAAPAQLCNERPQRRRLAARRLVGHWRRLAAVPRPAVFGKVRDGNDDRIAVPREIGLKRVRGCTRQSVYRSSTRAPLGTARSPAGPSLACPFFFSPVPSQATRGPETTGSSDLTLKTPRLRPAPLHASLLLPLHRPL